MTPDHVLEAVAEQAGLPVSALATALPSAPRPVPVFSEDVLLEALRWLAAGSRPLGQWPDRRDALRPVAGGVERLARQLVRD